MSFTYLRSIPDPDSIKNELPVSNAIAAIKRERDRCIGDILVGKSDLFLVIIGPCSAHDEGAVCEYVSRLARVGEETKEKLFLIPRIYTNKPRTLGTGYKGMLHQPDLLKGENMVEGIQALRRMHLRVVAESSLTAADEMLYPTNHPYLDDLLSYVAVGARSVENQQHRITASGIDIPAGMKNPISGDLEVMLNSIQAAQVPHLFAYNGFEVQTSGNPLAHAILRGAADQHGQNIPNYHFEELQELADRYTKRSCANPAVIIDLNHSNSGKRYREQPRIAREILESRRHCRNLQSLVKGVMIESFLVEGAQGSNGDIYGQSITDPCLGWDDSRRLLLDLAAAL